MPQKSEDLPETSRRGIRCSSRILGQKKKARIKQEKTSQKKPVGVLKKRPKTRRGLEGEGGGNLGPRMEKPELGWAVAKGNDAGEKKRRRWGRGKKQKKGMK